MRLIKAQKIKIINSSSLQKSKNTEIQYGGLARGEPRLELGVHLFGIILEFIRYAPSSIVFYLEMKVEVELGVHDIRSRFTPPGKVN